MSKKSENESRDESGFGMVEIVVSMFLLAVLAMAFLPLLIQSLQVSLTNASMATATQIVNKQLDDLRTRAASCATLTDFADDVVDPVADARGVLQPHRTVSACPATAAGYPATVTATVWVTKSGATARISEAVTLILVGGA